MRSLKQLAILSLAAALIQGCDAGSNPDAEARDKMNEGRIAAATGDETGRSKAQSDLTAAAGVSGASNISIAQAHAVLGQVQYETGLEMLRDADRKELDASRIALQIAALGAQLGNSATLVAGYQKLDPAPVANAIKDKIVQIKGGPDKLTWTPRDDVQVGVMSLAAAEQNVSRIQGEIATRQSQAKDLDAKRIAALKDADESMKAADAAKGRESVDAYKKYSDSKKAAADFQAQIDLITGQLAPLEKDLAIAVGQQQILSGAVTQLEEESKSLEEGWKDVQSKISAQTALIAQIATEQDASTQPSESADASGKSIAVKASILAKTVKDADDSRQKALDAIGNAIKEFEAAHTAANTAGGEMSEMASQKPALASVLKVAKEVLTPLTYTLREATAERLMGEMQTSKAAGLSARIKLREMLTKLMQDAQQPMPKELADTTLDAQLKDATAAADSSFNDADGHIQGVLDGPGSDSIATSTKKSAAVARIFLSYDQQQLALLQGDAKKADEKHAGAIAAVKSAADMQVNFPTLPGDLASAIPPPPAPAAGEATTAPAEGAAPATAEADSPDVQAIRVVTQTFLQALDKDDVNAAKAVCQIEPGQEETFNTVVSVVTESKKLKAAVQEKFGDQAAGMIKSMDPAAAMSAKVEVKGDEGFAASMPGAPPQKQFARVDGQWKIYFGAPTESEKPMVAMMTKLAAAMPTLTTDVQAGKYATMQEFFVALAHAVGMPAPGAPPAPAAGATPAPTGAPAAPAGAPAPAQ